MTPNINIIDLAEKHGQTSYRNRADTKHPAYGFTEEGLQAFAHALLAAAPQAVQPAVPSDAELQEEAAWLSAANPQSNGINREVQLMRNALNKWGADPAHPAEGVPAVEAMPDEFGTAEHWKEKAQYWAGVAHQLRSEALRGYPVDGITQPSAQGLDSAISEAVLEAVKAINLGNGDGRAYRAALGWIVAHLNQAVARSLAVDPSGKDALTIATAFAAQAKQGGAA